MHYEDFTENAYRELLKIAKGNWKFIGYPYYKTHGKVCLWRHDIDVSVHRAHRLAQIEAEEGVKATYFVLLHSEFYNLLEREITKLIASIAGFGHYLGLHFDPRFYKARCKNREDLVVFLKFEQEFLAQVFQTEIRALSIHYPTEGNWLNFDQDEVIGMVNAYGQYLRKIYTYCSDSEAYWRFRHLRDVLESAVDERLQVLTHPCWWAPVAMSPWARLSRCIDGRANYSMHVGHKDIWPKGYPSGLARL